MDYEPNFHPDNVDSSSYETSETNILHVVKTYAQEL